MNMFMNIYFESYFIWYDKYLLKWEKNIRLKNKIKINLSN